MRKKTLLRKAAASLLAMCLLIPSLSLPVSAGDLTFTANLETSKTAALGEPVTFTVAAAGAENISYQWYKDGAPIGGARGNFYTIPGASASDAGTYYAVATGASPTVVVDQDFSGIASGTVYNTQWNDLWPVSLSWANGANWAATVIPKDGGGNCLKLQNTGSSGDTELQCSVFQLTADIIDFTVSVKTGDLPRGIPGDEWYDLNEQVYIRSANNEIRLALHDTTLFHRDLGLTRLAENLTGFNKIRIVADNVSKTFDAYLNGAPVLTGEPYQGSAAIDGFFVTGNYHGPGQEHIRGLFYVDGVYAATTSASDIKTIESNRCALSVGGSPVLAITSDLSASKSAEAGNPVSFEIAASGASNLTYQWRKDGREIPLARADGASYAIPGAAKSDEGSYNVTVTGNTQPVTKVAGYTFDSTALGTTVNTQVWTDPWWMSSNFPSLGTTYSSDVTAVIVSRSDGGRCLEITSPASVSDEPRLNVEVLKAGEADYIAGGVLDMSFSVQEAEERVYITDIGAATGNTEGTNFRLALLDGSLTLENPGGTLLKSGLTKGEWHQIRITADNGAHTYKLYADGQLVGAYGYKNAGGKVFGLRVKGNYAPVLNIFRLDDIYVSKTLGAPGASVTSASCALAVTEGVTVSGVTTVSPVYSGDPASVYLTGARMTEAGVKTAVFDGNIKVSGDFAADGANLGVSFYSLITMPVNDSAVSGDFKTYTVRVSKDGGATYPASPSAAVDVYPEIDRPQGGGTYYVNANGGSDANGGKTPGSAFATIIRAAAAAQAGDTVVVYPGVYNGQINLTHSGEDGKPITFKAYGTSARDQFLAKTDVVAKLALTNTSDLTSGFQAFADDITPAGYPDAVIVKGDQYGFLITGSYIEVSGFFVTGKRHNFGPMAEDTDSGVGISVDGTKAFDKTAPVHHVNVYDNVVYRNGQSGISGYGNYKDTSAANRANGGVDYLRVKGNVVFQNSETSCWQGSGISLMGQKPFDLDADAWHFVVEDNLCFDNSNQVEGAQIAERYRETASGNTCPFGRQSGETDGNGIILDHLNDILSSANGTYAKYGRALVRNNILAFNGGRGLCLTASGYVASLNNTLYGNSWSPTQMYHWSEFESSVRTNQVFANNILVRDASIVGGSAGNAIHSNINQSGSYGAGNFNVGGNQTATAGFSTAISSKEAMKLAKPDAFRSSSSGALGGKDPRGFMPLEDSPATGGGLAKNTADAANRGWLTGAEFKAALPDYDFFGSERDAASMDAGAVMYIEPEITDEFRFTTDLSPSVIVSQNDPLVLRAEAANAANITYSWFKDGKEIPRARISADGKSYSIANATSADSGVYQAKATSYTQPVTVAANQNFDALSIGRKLVYQTSAVQPFCPSDLPPFGLSWNNNPVGVTVAAREGANNCLEVTAPASVSDRPRLTVDIAGAADAPGSVIDIRFSLREGVDDVFIRDIGSRTNSNDEGVCFRLRLSAGSLYNRDISPNSAIASGLTAGLWHDFRIVADNVAKKFDVYADGVLARSGVSYYTASGVAYGLMLEGEYAARLRTFYVDDVYVTRTTGVVDQTVESAECNVVVVAGAVSVDRVEAESPVYSGDIVSADIYGVNVNNTAAVKVAVFDAQGVKVSGNVSIDTTTDPGHVYALVEMPLNLGPIGDQKTYYIRVSPDAGATYPENPFAAVAVLSEASRPDTSTTYYVAKNGNNSSDGSQSSPFLTISKAVSVAQAGDTVVVSPGVYTETVNVSKSGTQGKPITITTEKASARAQFLANTGVVARLELTDLNSADFSRFGDDINNAVYPDAVIVKGDQYGFLITGSYIDVRGFFVTTNRRNVGPQSNQTDSAVGINIDGSKVPGGSGSRTQVVHHVNIIDNVVYRCGQAGISCFGDDSDRIQTGLPFAASNNNGGCDYLVIKGNVAFQNSETSCWQGSGIGLMGYKRTDLDESKWHFILEDNLCFDNSNKVEGQAIYNEWVRTGGTSGTASTCPFGRQRGETDGNGIILDWVARSAAGSSLVRNNILVHNGGRGLCLTATDYVLAVNNTIVDNSFSPTQMYNFAEFESNIGNGHIILANNIVANTRGANANHTRFSGSGNYLGYNLYVGGDALNGGFGTQVAGADALKFADFGAFSGTGPNLEGRTVDPRCLALREDSPANGTGYSKSMPDTTAKGWLSNERFKEALPGKDFFGNDRAQMDIGAVAAGFDMSDETPRITAASVFPEILTPAGGGSEITLQGLFVDGLTVTAKAFIGGEERPVSASAVFSGGTASLTLSFPANDTVENIVYTVKFSLDGGVTYQERSARVTVRTDIVLPPITIYDKGTADNMLARWLLSADTVDLENRVVTDVTGKGHDGVIIGSLSPAEAPYGGSAARFTANAGSPSYVGIPKAVSDDLKLQDVVTISAWISINAPLGEYTKPVWIGDARNAPWGAYGFEFMSPDTGNQNMIFTTGAEKTYGSGGKTEVWYDEPFAVGDWHMVTGVFTKSEKVYEDGYQGEREDGRYCQMLYIDGVLTGVKFTELHMGHYEDLEDSLYLMGIGATHSGDGPVSCDIGDVRIYGAALSAKDVMALYTGDEKPSKDRLAALLEEAKAINPALYTAASVAALAAAIRLAGEVMEDGGASAGDIENAEAALTSAMGGLRLASFSLTVKSMLAKIAKLQAIPYEWNGAAGAVEFATSNPAVCGVTPDGILIPFKAGIAVITVTPPIGAKIVFAVTVSA